MKIPNLHSKINKAKRQNRDYVSAYRAARKKEGFRTFTRLVPKAVFPALVKRYDQLMVEYAEWLSKRGNKDKS